MRSTVLRRLGLERFSALYLAVILIIVFGVWVPNLFLTVGALHSVASEQAVGGILALGVLIPLACGHYDLSVGATANLTAVTVVVLMNRGWSMWASIAIGLAIGLLVGLVNGALVVVFKINSFIATLGTSTILLALVTIVSGNSQPFPPANASWTKLTQRTIGGFEIIVLYLIVLAFIVWWFLAHTPSGRYIYAIGNNADAARLSGVSVAKWTWITLALSGLICGGAGVLYASQIGPSLTFGSALLLPAFAAAFMGATQVVPGRFNVWGTLIAIFVLAIGVQGVQYVTSVQWANEVFNGVALLLAVAFAGQRQRAIAGGRFRARSRPRQPSPSDGESDTTAAELPVAHKEQVLAAPIRSTRVTARHTAQFSRERNRGQES